MRRITGLISANYAEINGFNLRNGHKMYLYQHQDWPIFRWDEPTISPLLAEVRYHQGHLLGRVKDWGLDPKRAAGADTLVVDIVASSKIEGEDLPADQVRSSVANKLGLPDAGTAARDQRVEGVVDLTLDATQHYDEPLTRERLFGWHAALFPTGYSGLTKIKVAAFREHGDDDPMQVISGALGRPRVHFEAPRSSAVSEMMDDLLRYVEDQSMVDPILKAGLVHLWMVTIHPFDDGNGRLTRAITELLLCRADRSGQRFYSMSAAILNRRKYYYRQLEASQKGSLDVTDWLKWFLATLLEALHQAEETMSHVFAKAKFWRHHDSTPVNQRQRLIINKLWDGYGGKLTTSRYAKFTGVSQDTAGRDVNDLIEKGILIPGSAGGRSASYLLSDIGE